VPDEIVVQVVVPEIVVGPASSSITIAAAGERGPQGPAGVIVSNTPPINTNLIWVDTSGI
jgi:hypothetical protein